MVLPALALAANGAIAYNFRTGAVGKSWGYETQRGANAKAHAECRQHPRGRGGRCYVVLTTSGSLCGAVVRHRKEVYAFGFGPGRRVVNGFALNQREAIKRAGHGRLIAAVCADAP
jgi:hypothetical protein